jgi:RNA polymerase sigma-70 factor (ECF subfamily)
MQHFRAPPVAALLRTQRCSVSNGRFGLRGVGTLRAQQQHEIHGRTVLPTRQPDEVARSREGLSARPNGIDNDRHTSPRTNPPPRSSFARMNDARPLPDTIARQGASEDARALAFVGLAEAEVPGLYRLATLIVGNATLAEDLVGDAIERGWRTWPQLREPERFRAWITRIVVNACRDELRRRQRVRFVALEPGASTGFAPVERIDERDAIARAFATLDADERAVAVLRLDQDLELPEIARRLGIPLGTAKSRLHRALARMRTELSRTDP